jgi:hypothetical protein
LTEPEKNRTDSAGAGEPQNPVVIPEALLLAMKLETIFMPYATRQRGKLFADGRNTHARFVHYTSAEAALSIIQGKRVWMRNTTCMSDYREVQHGFDILNSFFSDKSESRAFINALDVCVPGAATEAIALFNQWWTDSPSSIRVNTYITSISDHDDKEDLHGRLSMWRAFGHVAARVAIVFRVPWYSGGTQALSVMFSPVGYLTKDEVHAELHAVIENVRANSAFLRTVDRSVVVRLVLLMLVAGVACLKHEGFREEREWRAIYLPKLWHSPLMESSTESVGGVPQKVYNFPLDVTVSDALHDLDITRIFDRLIIGPSPYPWVMYEAFVTALLKAGVSDAANRVFASNIPIRA